MPAPLSAILANAASLAGPAPSPWQLAGNLFLDRSDRSFRRKMQEILLALQIERPLHQGHKSLPMYANQVYLAHGNYGFAAAAQFLFRQAGPDLNLQEAALLAGMVNVRSFTAHESGTRAWPPQSGILAWKKKGRSHHGRKPPPGNHARSAIQYPPQRPRALTFFEEIPSILNHVRH